MSSWPTKTPVKDSGLPSESNPKRVDVLFIPLILLHTKNKPFWFWSKWDLSKKQWFWFKLFYKLFGFLDKIWDMDFTHCERQDCPKKKTKNVKSPDNRMDFPND